MSTLSGIATKGEKGKSKFQSLDINSLYRASRGESLETHQHKNTSSRRHGMQTLGKVPSARRAPANLPSLKSEYSGNDPAVSLVPSGGTGWGSKPGETGPPPSVTQAPSSTTPTPPLITVAPAATITVTTPPINTPTTVAATTIPSQNHSDKSWSSITSSGTEATPMFLAHQSPYFQQEFPSLSGDPNAASGPGTNKTETSHLPGPSLRPQTEGSWIQGGSRPQGQMGAGVGNQQGTVPAPGPLSLPQGLEVGGSRNNLVQSGVGVGPGGPIPPAGMPPHHYRLMPQFMIRHNHTSGNFPSNYQHVPPRPRFPYPSEPRFIPPNRSPLNMDQEEISTRPIIKEEDLQVMDEIARDTGWATHDEIDYNQTLSFSDEEGTQGDDELKGKHFRQSLQIIDKQELTGKPSEKENNTLDSELVKETSREPILSSQSENKEANRVWQQSRPTEFRQKMSPTLVTFPPQAARVPNHQNTRQGEDEEVWRERRRLQNEEIAVAVERAKQRKEEEEKRYEETRQAAARKLQMLEEKMRSKLEKDENSLSPPLNPQHGCNVLLPDWEKDKEKSRSRTSSEEKEDTTSKDHLDTFRNVQMDNRSFPRERERDRDQRPERENVNQPFSRQFQNNLPPRFQKQAAEKPSPYYRQGSGGSPQPPTSGHPAYDVRWPISQVGSQFGGTVNIKSLSNLNVSDISELERGENKDSNKDHEKNIADNELEGSEKERYEKYQELEEYKKEKENEHKSFDGASEVEKKANDNNKSNDSQLVHQVDLFDDQQNINDSKIDNEKQDVPQKLKDHSEIPQRPDSQDSRTSRESRNSRGSIKEDNKLHEENDESLSWADSTYETDSKEEILRREIRDERDTRRDLNTMQPYHLRHIPGPITREKLEASEMKCDSARSLNLVPLIRSEKKAEVTKNDHQWDIGSNSEDVWHRTSPSPGLPAKNSECCWSDMSASSSSTIQVSQQLSDLRQGEFKESLQQKDENIEVNQFITKLSTQEKDDVGTIQRSDSQRENIVGRGGNRGMRLDSRGSRQGWGNSYYRGGAPLWRGGDIRGRRSNHRKSNPVHEWTHSESEASADEISVSTESGKEDKRQEQEHKDFIRSPKQGSKKFDKDERIKDSNRRVESDKDNYYSTNDSRRFEKKMYEGNRMGNNGFEPRGEPSRRGRGAPFRSKGSTANVGRRMDGYGPPTSKRPFTSESSNVHEDKKTGNSQNQSVKEDALIKLTHDEKIKINQQQLSAGIIGNVTRLESFKSQPTNIPPRLRRKSEGERRERKPRETSRKGPQGVIKSGSLSGGEVGDENWETTSETSEHEDKECDKEDERVNDGSRRIINHHLSSVRGQSRRSQTNRSVVREKRNGGSYDRDRDHNARRHVGIPGSQSVANGNGRTQANKSTVLLKDQLLDHKIEQSSDKKQPRLDSKEKRNNLDRIDLCNTASVVVVDDQPEVTAEEDQTVFATDNNGFQEVRSKKNVKEANRQQKDEPHKGSKERPKLNKPPSSQSPGPAVGSHMSVPSINKGSYERPRAGKLPPRFAKMRENTRLQKIAQQQQQTIEVNELNKINQGGVSIFPIKDMVSPAPPPPVNAWDKPITGVLRSTTPPTAPNTITPITVLSDPCNIDLNEHTQSGTSSQRSSPSGDKNVIKLSREQAEKDVLDGASPPVQTIIFENTNYKSAPIDVAMKSKYSTQINKNHKPDKSRERKQEEDSVALGFKSPGPDMKLHDNKVDSLQMPISFNKNEDNADMKLDFRFDSDLSQLTDDKTTKSITAIQMTRSIQMTSQSSAAELQIKLASVKKVWENPSTVLEHGSEDSGSVSTATSFTPTFGNSVEDGTTYNKSGVPVADPNVTDDGSTLTSEGVYNTSQQLQNNSNTYNGSTVQNMIKPDPSSNVCKVKPQPQAAMHPHSGPLSPPSGAFNSSPAQPGQHINYQPPAQYGGISAIPSPPTVFTPQAEIYPTFQLNNQVIGNQGRSQFSQFASPYLSQSLGQTSGFNQQSMYLHQTAPPPPSAAPPDMFQTQLSQYRIQPAAYGTSQQLSNNPNTVLISSSTNSLMSASVKPSPQPIGAIGSKGASYQAPSQPPPSQLYIYPDPQLLNQSPYLQNSQLVQRPASNVVPTIPPSSASYYSASTGGGATGFYQPGNSNMQAAAQSLHQTTFGMQAFNTQSPAATPAGMGSFGSTFLSNGLQMAQQYRSTAPSYLKSAADHQDVLSVFSPVTQINSPKPRTSSGGGGSGGKSSNSNGPSQQQPSPTQSHHKFSTYQQNVSPSTQLMIQQQQQRGSLSVRVAPRYPAPIQRPVNFQPIGRHRLPMRYKIPPPSQPHSATATTASHFFVIQNNSTKRDSTNLEAKGEVVNSECENNTSTNEKKNTADINMDDSVSTND